MFLEIYPHLFWRADPEEYSCSGRTQEEWAATGSPAPLLGLYFMITGAILLVFYCIIIACMTHRKILDNPCFKIMYFNCYIDFCSIAFNSVLTGYLFYEGAVFCTHPTIGYAPGAFGLAFWCSSCFNCIALGINRICTVSKRLNGVFDGYRVYMWIGASISLMLFIIGFTRQASFNSTMGAWFFFPFIEDIGIEVVKYKNYFHVAINLITAMGTTLLYVTLCTFVVIKSRENAHSEKLSAMQFKIFLQCFVICLSTCLAAYLYAYMQFFPVSPDVIVSASIAWQLCSATPIFVYFFLNSTVRNRVIGVVTQFTLHSTLGGETFYSHNSVGPSSGVHTAGTAAVSRNA